MSETNSIYHKKLKDGSYLVQIYGAIDEVLELKNLILDRPKEIILDFEKTTVIKSYGIRELIRWQTKYAEAKFTYRNCQKMIIDQINLVEGFLPPKAHVESFYVPYYCEKSGEESCVLFRYGHEFHDSEVTPPQIVRDTQGNKMEMDVVWTKYFRFIEAKKAA